MTRDELRAAQAPLKEKYRQSPESALVTLRARGTLGEGVTCDIEVAPAPGGVTKAGLHPATGGSGREACSGDMLLQSLVACSGVTLSAVATALGLAVRGGTLVAEGDVDFRGTLGVAKDGPVGFTAIRLRVALDTDATAAEIAKLLELTERYCVVYPTLKRGVPTTVSYATGPT